MSDHPDDDLERRLRARFAQTCETLDPRTRRELRRRRETALESARTRRPALWLPLAPASAMAAAFVIALAIWPTPPRSGRLVPAPTISAEAAQETADDTAQSLDDDPDFYLWLATEPVADDDSTSRSAAAQEGDR